MKKKSIVAAAMILALAALAVAEGSKEAATPSGQPRTVQYAFWGNPQAIGVEQDIINAFQANYPAIRIEPVVSGYPDYHAKLLTLIAGGAAPDVMRISSQFFSDFLQASAMLDLTAMAKSAAIDLNVYYPLGIEENSYQGRLYGLPWGTAPIYMLINLKMLRDAGLAVPARDWGWDDFSRLVKAVTKGSGADKQFGFAMIIQADLYPVLPFVWANGGDLFDGTKKKFTLDQPAATEAIQKLATLYQQGFMPAETLNVATQAATVPRWMINNKLAMFQGTASDILAIQSAPGVEFEAWTLPNGRIKNTAASKSNIMGISARSRNVADAWTFLQYVRGPSGEGEAMYMKARRIPPTINDPKYWALYMDPTKYPKQIQQITSDIFTTYGRGAPLRPGYLEIEKLLVPIVQGVFLGQQTAEAAIKAVAPQVQAIMDKTNWK